LKPEVSQFQDGGPEGETSLTELENSAKHYIVRIDQTKLIVFSRTGMFNLIVKDPCRIPPERAALDQGIRSLAACPRTCCAAYGGYNLRSTSVFTRIYQTYRSFWKLSRNLFTGFLPVFPDCAGSIKFERSAQNGCASAHAVLAGNIAQEGISLDYTMDCSLWKVLPSLPAELSLPAIGQPDLD
jgi:hypothetical protein